MWTDAIAEPRDLVVDPQDAAQAPRRRLDQGLVEHDRHLPVERPRADQEHDGQGQEEQNPIEERHADFTTDVQ